MRLILKLLGFSGAFCLFLFTPAGAYAHTVYHLEGRKYVVVCDNGYAFDFGGSEQGAYDVADILCPDPPLPPLASVGPRTTRALPHASAFVMMSRNGRYLLRPEVAVSLRTALFRGYPPHGYPCLGCEPCPGNPTEFCDIVGIRAHPGAVAQGWSLNRAGRLVRSRPVVEPRSVAQPRAEPRPQ